ncbi:hypothetical protein QKU58_gp079 [Pyramimonas orientalis virus]|uniref:Uncharacterized protein n=1 Tax=Pyramimonas orientalis virus 01B TaxID=3134525 RepID=A0A7M3UNJ1_9VIRU|nr:hypothetical protein QKU58_gp079 [Pyramimonas orientalis virus]QOI90252.1 hypothetical protein HWQ62_00115 [Pyramimonas orientalis virus]
MIEFFVIGSVISFLKFNQNINHTFDHDIYEETNDTTCTSSDFVMKPKVFNRFNLMLLFLYNFLYTLFVMMVFIYFINLIEFLKWYFLTDGSYTGDRYTLLVEIAQKNGMYMKFFENKDLFIRTILKALGIAFVINLIFVNLIIMFRGGKTETQKKKIKADFYLLSIYLLSTSILTFIFL